MMKAIVFYLQFFLCLILVGQTYEVSYYDTTYTYLPQNSWQRDLKDSLGDGAYILYYPTKPKKKNEFIYKIVNFSCGKKNGILYEYSYSPKYKQYFLYKILFYKDNKKNGNYFLLNSTGEIIVIGNYYNDKKDGKWMFINQDNILLLNYENDNCLNWKKMMLNGNIISEGNGFPMEFTTFSQ